jgi:translocation and assembly module TamB
MRFKSVLGAFIFIMVSCLIAVVVYIQTESFGRVASKIISDIAKKKANIDIGIKSLSVSLLPPGIEINQVKLKKKISKEEHLEAELGTIGLYVGLVELEEAKMSFGKLRVKDSILNVHFRESEERIEKIDEKIIENIFNYSKNLPFRFETLLFENTILSLNDEDYEIKRLKILKRKENFLARFQFANLKLIKESAFVLDEIWGDVEIGRKDISIQRLKVQHDVHSLLVKGKIKNYPQLRNSTLDLSGEANLYLKNLKDEISFPKMLKLNNGFAHVSFNLDYINNLAAGKIDLSISDLESSVIKADQLIVEAELGQNSLWLNNFNLVHGNEKLELLKSEKIYTFNDNKISFESLDLRMADLNLNNVLLFMPALKPLKGNLTGNINLDYQNEILNIRLQDGFLVENLALIVNEQDPFEILKIKRAKFSKSDFRVVDNEFQMDSQVELGHSQMGIKGKVNSKEVEFKALNSVIDFQDFGNISQLDVKGISGLDVIVAGSTEDTMINLKGKSKGFEILGYKLGSTDKDITISLKDSTVFVNKLESLYRETPISGTGSINYGNLDIALGINSPRANFHDLSEILHPIFSKLDFLPEDLDFNARIDANIFGKTKMDQLKLKSDIQFRDMTAYGENINSGELLIRLNNQHLSLTDLTMKKGGGEITGDFNYNLKSSFMKLSYEWSELGLSSFRIAKKVKLNLDGVLSGSIIGEGRPDDFLFKLKGQLAQTQSQDFKFDDSFFNFNLRPKFVSGDLDLMGNIVKANFDLSLIKNGNSKINFLVDSPNIKPFATAFLGQHLESENFTGSLKLNLQTHFKGFLENLFLNACLENVTFKHQNFNVNYFSDNPQFLIEDGLIKRWNLRIQDKDFYIQTKGSGHFGRNVILSNEVNFNSKILEILFSSILSADGLVRNEFIFKGDIDRYNFLVKSRSDDLNLTLEGLPFPLNDLSYSIEASDGRLSINEFQTSLENGSLSIKGDVLLENEYPDINLKYILDKAEIPILSKSIINLSGEGLILGNSPPYNVGGEIILNKAQIVNELTDFSSKSNALSNVRFLPPSQESVLGKFFNFNVNVKTDAPIRITNSLMDISLRGEVMLSGSPSRLKGDGNLRAPLNTSRIFFKNNEYFLTNVDINFSPKKEVSNPDFDIHALTYISNYKVNAKAYGDLERFNFDLTSEPALTRNSILSLIAFGYSDEIQSTLTQDQQQNLTQVGVGSFVFDRFKISDILNKQFGLQVNLGTVFEQSQTASLLSGRSQDGQGLVGRTRTATKIELKKRLDDALNLSVSSTMGGSIGQRQSMNLNYSLNKKVQLEGVYELRTNAEGEEDIIDNSIGGDLKFRWTFK